MKLRPLIAIIALCMLTFTLTAQQSETSLALTNQGIFQLPDEGLKAIYTLDIESLELTTLQEGIAYFEDKNTEFVLFRPNSSFETASVFLLLEKRPEWSVSDWNNYLANIILTNN